MNENVSDFQNIDPDDHIFNNMFSGTEANSVCNYFSVENYNNLDFGSDRNFLLFNCNLRSFNANGSTFEALFGTLSKKPNAIVCTETWNSPSSHELCKFNSYNSFHTFRDNSRGGGVSVFCETGFRVQKVAELSVCNLTMETCVCRIGTENGYIIICAVYRPHTDSIENFATELESLLSNPVIKNASTILLAGDLNLNISNLECANVQFFKSIMFSLCFIPVITKPTRFSPESSYCSTLDQIWISKSNFLLSGILLVDISDHLPSFMCFSDPLQQKFHEKRKITFRPYSDQKFKLLKTSLANIDWHKEIGRITSVQEAYNNFVSKIDGLYCQHFPSKVKYISEKRIKNSWLSPNLKHLINQKCKYYKLFKLGLISRDSNNRFRNKVNSEVRKGKSNYFLYKFEQSILDIKKTWNIIKNLMGCTNKKNIIDSITFAGKEFSEHCDIAEQFNEYFGSVASKLDNLLPEPEISPLLYMGPPKPNSFYLFDISEAECAKIISKLKVTRTAPNVMPVRIFKQLKYELSKPLCILINLSFKTGTFPSSLKVARITPIFKKGDKKMIENYRPIASLPYISKIFERIMANRLLSFFNKFNLISKSQYGFQKNKSTGDALINLTELIYSGLDSREYTLNIFIDLSKAFDTVNHRILLDKLFICGIRGLPLLWLENYLKDRKQYVGRGDSASSLKISNLGVPQGSILGPILFLLYVNDLPSVSNVLSATLFADDTTLTISHPNYDELVVKANRELEPIISWTQANRLTVNVNKTEMILISNRSQTNTDDQIVLNNEYIKFNETVMFLGVKIDTGLTFNNHISYITTKLSKSTGIFYRIRDNLNERARLNFYYGFMYPLLSYNILAWGGTYDTYLNQIIIQQKRIVRLIANSDRLAHTTPLFYQYKILKIADVYRYFISIHVFKARKSGLYTTDHVRSTRNRDLAVPTFHRLTSSQHSVSYAGPTIWNQLPEYIRCIDKLPKFKTILKKFLLDKYSP